MFAFNFTGDSAHSKEIMNDIIESFNGFRVNIDETELNRAKNILKRNIITNTADQVNRLEETAKSVKKFNLVQYFWKSNEL